MPSVMPSPSEADRLDRILYIWQTIAMKTVSYTDARNQLASLMEAANADREPVAITRNGAASVVLVDAAEYAAMAETFHLLSSPRNADRLRKGLSEFKAGKFKKASRG
jgi:antitoxin YefM